MSARTVGFVLAGTLAFFEGPVVRGRANPERNAGPVPAGVPGTTGEPAVVGWIGAAFRGRIEGERHCVDTKDYQPHQHKEDYSNAHIHYVDILFLNLLYACRDNTLWTTPKLYGRI